MFRYSASTETVVNLSTFEMCDKKQVLSDTHVSESTYLS